MESVEPPALDSLRNQLSSFLCKLQSAPDNEKSAIVEFLKSTVSQLEVKQPSCGSIPLNIDCNADNAVSTGFANAFSCDAKLPSTELGDRNMCDTEADEGTHSSGSSSLRGSLVSTYESTDLFLKDIFNSTFSDQAVMSSLFEPESSRDAVNSVNTVSVLPEESGMAVAGMTEDTQSRELLVQSPPQSRLKPKEPLVLSCPICRCTFTNWSAMEHHLYTGHTTNLAPVCWRCQGVFDNHATLLAHECFDWGRVHLPCQGANNRSPSGLTGRHRALLRRGMQLGFPKNGVFLRRRCGLCFKSSKVFHSSSEFREHKKITHASDEICSDELNSLSRGRRMRKKQNRSDDPDNRDPMELLHPRNEADLQTCVRRIIGRFCQMHDGSLSVSSSSCPVTSYTDTSTMSVHQHRTSSSTLSSGLFSFLTSTEATTTNTITTMTATDFRNSQTQSSSEHTPPILAEAIFQEAIHTSRHLNRLVTNTPDQRMRRGRTWRTMLWRRKRKLQLRRIHGITRLNSEQETSRVPNKPRKGAAARRRYVCRCCFTEFRVASRLRAHHLFQHGNIPASLGGLSPRPGERGGTRSLRHESRIARSHTRARQSSLDDELEEPAEQGVQHSVHALSSFDSPINQLKTMTHLPNPLTTESVEVSPVVTQSSTVDPDSSSNSSSLSVRRRPKGSRPRSNRTDRNEVTSNAPSSSNPPYVCAFCNRQYLTVHSLRRHESQSHRGQYRLYCGYCDYRTNERTAYDEHLARHFHVRQFACTFCNARFIVERELKDHMAFKHTNERNHLCKVCGMAFKTAGTLSRHRKIHGERKLHECNLCLNKYTRLSNLKRHMINAHTRRRNGRSACAAPVRAYSDAVPPTQSLADGDSNQGSLTWAAGDFDSERDVVITTAEHNQPVIASPQPQSPPQQVTATQEFQFIQLPTTAPSNTAMETTVTECDPSSHRDSTNMCALLNEQLEVGCQHPASQVNEDDTCGVSNDSSSLGPVYVVDLTDLATSEGLLDATANDPAELNHPSQRDTCIIKESNADANDMNSDSVCDFGTNEQPQPMSYTMSTSISTAATCDASLLRHGSSASMEHATESVTWTNPSGCSQSGLCYLLTRVDSPSDFLCSEPEIRPENGVVEHDIEKHDSIPSSTGAIPVALSCIGDGGSALRRESIQLICSYQSSPTLLNKTTGDSAIWRPMEPLEADYSGVDQLSVTASHVVGHNPTSQEQQQQEHQQQQQQQEHLILTSIRSFDTPSNHGAVSQKPIQTPFNPSGFYTFDSNVLLNSEDVGVTNLSHSPRFPSPVSGVTSPHTILYPTSPVQSHLAGYCFPDGTSGDSISLSATTSATTIANSVKSTGPLSFAVDDTGVNLNFSHTNQPYVEDGTMRASCSSSSSHFVTQFLPPIWCYSTLNATTFRNVPPAHTSPSSEFSPNSVDQCSNFSVGYLIGQNRAPCSADQQNLAPYALSPQSSITSPTTATYFEFDGTMS